jgi:osmotically-inducible protein OsmY
MVQTLDDTDNAAEVASRVAGVVDVVDELDVEL